jgi:S-adenosylmethionine:tRNA ribosyltransferase-isomerase
MGQFCHCLQSPSFSYYAMKTELFDYHLPESFIAQQPAEPRDSSRLLVLDRATGQIEHRIFRNIGSYLTPGDLLIANSSRVIPARLRARKRTGGAVEILLLRQLDADGMIWECLLRGRNLVGGTVLEIVQADKPVLNARIESSSPESAQRVVHFAEPVTATTLATIGQIPLPPYIQQYAGDMERYQTVYSQTHGSVAAPTAGLHFTSELLLHLRQMSVRFDTVTLHVGLGTFQPVTAPEISQHTIHEEWAELTPETANLINQTSLEGGRVVAIGTTAVRSLEWAATMAQGIDPYDPATCPWRRTAAFSGDVNLFIQPGYRFRAVDILLTNFHLPRSTLLMLVSAFIGQVHPSDPDAGRQILLDTYSAAKQEGYRFFSFGDAMLIL